MRGQTNLSCICASRTNGSSKHAANVASTPQLFEGSWQLVSMHGFKWVANWINAMNRDTHDHLQTIQNHVFSDYSHPTLLITIFFWHLFWSYSQFSCWPIPRSTAAFLLVKKTQIPSECLLDDLLFAGQNSMLDRSNLPFGHLIFRFFAGLLGCASHLVFVVYTPHTTHTNPYIVGIFRAYN